MIKISNLAEPYPEDSEELNTLDGDPIDGNRALAALAKKILVGEK